MGQRMSSDNQKVSSTATKKSSAARGEVVVLPDEETYLGRCWLLASSPDSFSPSRWFALSAANMNGAREKDRRAFAIASELVKPAQRSRQPVLRDLHITVHRGLAVCGFPNITVTTVSADAAQQRHSLRVGGVQVELPKLSTLTTANDKARSPAGEAGATGSGGVYVIVVVRRASVEMEPRDYASAPYTRFPVKAPPSTAEERRQYGEGCITGVLYGASVVLRVQGDEPRGCAEVLVRACETAAEPLALPSSSLQVQEEHISGGLQGAATVADRGNEEGTKKTVKAAAASSSGNTIMLLDVRASDEASNILKNNLNSEKLGEMTMEEALTTVATWAVQVHQQPAAWAVLNLFLQRYEAVAESLLIDAKR